MKTLRSDTTRMALLSAALLLVGVSTAQARTRTYEGDIVAVNTKTQTFTVRGTTTDELTEMAFHANPASQIAVNGERQLLGELTRGQHVVVTYMTNDTTAQAPRSSRTQATASEETLAGTIVGVDLDDQSFTVRKAADGMSTDIRFHVDPSARLYIDGEEVVLAELRRGDAVTVTYEPARPAA